MAEQPKPSTSHSRDKRTDCLQGGDCAGDPTDGFPLAYEVMARQPPVIAHYTARVSDKIEKTMEKQGACG